MYREESLQEFLGIPVNARKSFAYVRVSSHAQKPDLKNQRKAIEDFCILKGMNNVDFIEKIGGGLNFTRKKFLEIVDMIEGNEVNVLVIAHKDRLCRFGFEYFERLCERHSCQLIILSQESLSPPEEMIQDLMTIVHCFSSRLDGLKNYKKSLKEALSNDSSS